MASLLQRLLTVFDRAQPIKKTTNASLKPVINNIAATKMSIPDVSVANEIIDTSSLFYDLLFNNKDMATEASVARPEHVALNVVRLPEVLHKVSALIDSDNYTAEQLAALITQDPMLAADVIKLVNSAGYQLGSLVITNLQEAVVHLGGLQIKSIVLTLVMQNMTDIKPIYFKLFGRHLWQHSLTTALWAKSSRRVGERIPT